MAHLAGSIPPPILSKTFVPVVTAAEAEANDIFILTSDGWVSLQGPPGVDGVDGAEGAAGATGATGPVGPSGQAAGKIYYPAPSASSDISGYKKALVSPSAAAEQTIATACPSMGVDVLVATFATEPGIPGAVDYPAGTAFRRIYASVNVGTARFHILVYKRDGAGTETLVRDEYSPGFTDSVVTEQFWTATSSAAGALAAGDRLVIKIYAQRYSGGGSGTTVTTYWEGSSHASQFQTTISAGAQGPQGATGPTGPAGPAGLPVINWRGDYSAANAYAINDGVFYQGSSYRCTGAPLAAGERAPGTPPPTAQVQQPGIGAYIDAILIGKDVPATAKAPQPAYNYFYSNPTYYRVNAAPGSVVTITPVGGNCFVFYGYSNGVGEATPSAPRTFTMSSQGHVGIEVAPVTTSVTASGTGVAAGQGDWTLIAQKGDAGAAGGLVARTTSVVNATAAAGAEVEVDHNLHPGVRVLRVQADKACRIRAYPNDAYRDADAARAPGTDPSGDHGVLMDMRLAAGDVDYALAPVPDLYSMDGSSTLRFLVKNEAATANVAVTLTYIRTE